MTLAEAQTLRRGDRVRYQNTEYTIVSKFSHGLGAPLFRLASIDPNYPGEGLTSYQILEKMH